MLTIVRPGGLDHGRLLEKFAPCRAVQCRMVIAGSLAREAWYVCLTFRDDFPTCLVCRAALPPPDSMHLPTYWKTLAFGQEKERQTLLALLDKIVLRQQADILKQLIRTQRDPGQLPLSCDGVLLPMGSTRKSQILAISGPTQLSLIVNHQASPLRYIQAKYNR